MGKLFGADILRKHWGTGKPLIYKGKKYRVGKMSYGDYFLEPITFHGGEMDGFHKETLWLVRKAPPNEYFYEIEK